MATPSVVSRPNPAGSAPPAPRADPAGGRRHYGSQTAAYAAVLIISFISLFPLYWMLVNSFRSDADISSGIAFWPESWHFDNYSSAWNALAFPFQTFIINSFVVSVLVVIGVASSSLIVAYGFARFDFPGRGFLFGLVISTTMIPYAVMMIPQYAEFINVFHWGSGGNILGHNNAFQFLPIIVPAYFGSPIYIFLLRQFIRGIPYDLDEAAKIDGAGPIRVLWSIILPAVRPALAAVIVLQFIGTWNDLLAPFIYLQDPQNWTIEIALLGYFSRYASSTSGSNWAEFMAMALVTMTPILVLYLSASKQIIQGVTLSGVKG
ncbi:MAG TPA: carbohydrate ABC transporter permease [Chloroflexota bacterium]|nr:carbohydrate ABC transporter permease [Chloroflexota bacterium]